METSEAFSEFASIEQSLLKYCLDTEVLATVSSKNLGDSQKWRTKKFFPKDHYERVKPAWAQHGTPWPHITDQFIHPLEPNFSVQFTASTSLPELRFTKSLCNYSPELCNKVWKSSRAAAHSRSPNLQTSEYTISASVYWPIYNQSVICSSNSLWWLQSCIWSFTVTVVTTIKARTGSCCGSDAFGVGCFFYYTGGWGWSVTN